MGMHNLNSTKAVRVMEDLVVTPPSHAAQVFRTAIDVHRWESWATHFEMVMSSLVLIDLEGRMDDLGKLV